MKPGNVRNKGRDKKQAQAIERLLAARDRGPHAVALEVVTGNQYSRQVAKGYLLAEGVERFLLTEKESAIAKTLSRCLARQTDEQREQDRSRLRSGDLGVYEYINACAEGMALSQLMDSLVEEAKRGGRISDSEYQELKRKRQGQK